MPGTTASSSPPLALHALGQVFHSSPNAYVVLDRGLNLVEMNQSYLAVTMRRREDILGRNMFEAFPSDPRSESHRMLRTSLERVVDTGKVDHLPLIRYDIDRPDGSIEERFWSATHTPLLGADGSVAFVLQHTADVTELHRLRQRHEGSSDMGPRPLLESDVLRRAQALQETNYILAEDRRRLQALFAQAPSFMAVLRGADYVFELANHAYLRVIGRSDVIGRPLRDVLPEIAAQGFIDLLDEVRRTGSPFVGRGVKLRLRPTGAVEPTEVYLDFVYQPVVEEDGSVSAIFVQGHDITEQRRAEEALQHLNATLEQEIEERTRVLLEREEALRHSQKMEVVGQLTGGISHDFNNLLQIIMGNLQILERNLPQDSVRLRRSTSHAMQGAKRAAVLTQRLLAFSRRQPLEPRRLDPTRLVREMSDLLHRTLGESVDVNNVLEENVGTVEVDANQLENAILNLAVNARDAMPSGGQLTIGTSAVVIGPGSQRPADMAPGSYVCITVADTGTGMSAETLDKAFDPFFTTKETGKGTGLGLSMVYGFVRQSGGHVVMDSSLGVGTVVRIYLPRVDGDAEHPGDPAPGTVQRGTEEEIILVVEDNDDVRFNSAEMLRELGYRVLEAHDGPSALSLLQRQTRVDLLFTDVVLPGGSNGAEVAQAAARMMPGLKVLFTTGYDQEVIARDGRLQAGIELLTKPFLMTDLAAKVRTILDRSSVAAREL